MKKHDVLVLNRAFIPIHIITWQKCMSLLIQEAARALDRDFIVYDLKDWFTFSLSNNDYPDVSTVKQKISVPEIVVLKVYDQLPIRDVKYSRQTLFQRDKYHCAYCNQVFDRNNLTIDHIIPRSKGGQSNWHNTVSCCKACNFKKADRTPEQAGMKLSIKPKKPVWFSPLSGIKSNHPCKSWLKFMDRALLDVN